MSPLTFDKPTARAISIGAAAVLGLLLLGCSLWSPPRVHGHYELTCVPADSDSSILHIFTKTMGDPLPGVHIAVSLVHNNYHIEDFTNPAGSVGFELAGGEYVVSADLEGFASQNLTVSISSVSCHLVLYMTAVVIDDHYHFS